MTIADQKQGEDGSDLAREAAHWFARMRSPDADASRGDFDVWLAQGPEQRAAYNRAAEIFAMGKLLAEPEDVAPAPAPRHNRARTGFLAVIAVCALGGGAWVVWHPTEPARDTPPAIASIARPQTVTTVAGETRVVRLADGSTVRLVSDTALEVDIDDRRRRLKLLHGAARFEVAHERRPFIVFAGGGSVTARGTIFEVALVSSGKVDVRLLQGAIDVALPRRDPQSPPPVRKLVAGESVSFAGLPESAATIAPTSAITAPHQPAANDYEAMPVAELVALANRGAARPIRLADPALGSVRVSGRFRIDDTELLARRLGALFDHGVDTHDPREVVLTARR